MQSLYEYTKIRENIWQIAEDDGVFCTLIRGSEMAVLLDTGYGNRNLREFVEKSISTPYLVINSHGHPDHIGGNHWFEEIRAAKEEWDVIGYFQEKPGEYRIGEITPGDVLSLGNLHLEIISLKGHTKGSIGVLVQEERILAAGDGLNEGLWLFNYGALSMEELYGTLKRTMEVPFDYYICGHSNELYKKGKLNAHLRNIESLNLEHCTRETTIGFDTYISAYEDLQGKSQIVFTMDRL